MSRTIEQKVLLRFRGRTAPVTAFRVGATMVVSHRDGLLDLPRICEFKLRSTAEASRALQFFRTTNVGDTVVERASAAVQYAQAATAAAKARS